MPGNGVQLIAPPGYQSLEAFDREKHAGLGARSDATQSVSTGLNAFYITSSEFIQASRHYPVVFSHNAERDIFQPAVVVGFANGQNLFVNEQGEWEAGCYVPAYVRRYPFCIAEVHSTDSEAVQSLVCVDPTALQESEQAYIDADGQATEQWQHAEHFLREYEKARQATELFTASLQEHDLFEVFEARAEHVSGQQFQLSQLYRVSEKKLEKLSAKVLKQLMANKYLYLVYAHLISLDNFQQLLNRCHK